MDVREHGQHGPTVIAVHGGPGAAGNMKPIGQALADAFFVLEPFQRTGTESDHPLTVAQHVEDLHELIARRCAGSAPALVGHSWGAMLILAFAAAHPEHAGPLVLVGCGTFDTASRHTYKRILAERLGADIDRRINALADDHPDPGERLAAAGRLIDPACNLDPVDDGPRYDQCDMQTNRDTWRDMLRCQDRGIYPAAFARIDSPVLMLHGDYDPHPGPMIRDHLKPYLPDLEYVELPHCGHDPWRERHAHQAFFTALRRWLMLHAPSPTPHRTAPGPRP
jgi:pimeloyl-ACP methyl ester carboxylesterase